MGDLSLQALGYGLLCGVALPLGALAAALRQFSERTVAAVTALGAGALLAALTLDLVSEQLHKGEFYTLAAGCLLGGVVFELLNQVVNARGGFLRKTATTFAHLRRQKLQTFRHLARRLSQVPLLHQLPPRRSAPSCPSSPAAPTGGAPPSSARGSRGTACSSSSGGRWTSST